ncbi:putative cysteine biosynthesis protein [Rhizobium freirei PRF 81]|uniref:Putative cysteine biosynthesis protein n=1 Tax=Rhizobium freirei PRF 81 TaxID=363754 RepID=N6V940_9HYPH|nr:sulfate transporter family protein [Rhizobium freirei]ENN87517.1 putative cysteine biosynthesis protein [Rhizobium freirei PRF 81]
MIVLAARLAFENLFAPETRKVFWKVLGLTFLALVVLWFALRGAFNSFVLPWLQGIMPSTADWTGWLTLFLGIFAGIALALAMALLISPVTALIAGLFLDDVAEVVEKRDYPSDVPGIAMPIAAAMKSSVRFLGVVIVGNIVALLLLFIPGVNLVAFFLVNGYLLGREFFEFAAMRFRSPDEAREFRVKHAFTVFLAGLVIAAFLAIPLLNLLTPLFAAGMMVHLHKLILHKETSVQVRRS